MLKLKRKRDDEQGANWMTTYSDLMTLLLTFFVLLFSMAAIDSQKYEEIKESLRSSFLHISGGERFEKDKGEVIFSIINDNQEGNNTEYDESGEDTGEIEVTYEEIVGLANRLISDKVETVKREMEQAIENLGLSDYISVVREEHNIVYRVDSVVLFDLGKADIKDSGMEVLDRFSGLLQEAGNDIMIKGHADDLPINTLLFPSNWELSTKRATNVVLYLAEYCGIPPDKLTATGNAEYRPLYPNDCDENRQKNRRIDIVITGEYSISDQD